MQIPSLQRPGIATASKTAQPAANSAAAVSHSLFHAAGTLVAVKKQIGDAFAYRADCEEMQHTVHALALAQQYRPGDIISAEVFKSPNGEIQKLHLEVTKARGKDTRSEIERLLEKLARLQNLIKYELAPGLAELLGKESGKQQQLMSQVRSLVQQIETVKTHLKLAAENPKQAGSEALNKSVLALEKDLNKLGAHAAVVPGLKALIQPLLQQVKELRQSPLLAAKMSPRVAAVLNKGTPIKLAATTPAKAAPAVATKTNATPVAKPSPQMPAAKAAAATPAKAPAQASKATAAGQTVTIRTSPSQTAKGQIAATRTVAASPATKNGAALSVAPQPRTGQTMASSMATSALFAARSSVAVAERSGVAAGNVVPLISLQCSMNVSAMAVTTGAEHSAQQGNVVPSAGPSAAATASVSAAPASGNEASAAVSVVTSTTPAAQAQPIVQTVQTSENAMPVSAPPVSSVLATSQQMHVMERAVIHAQQTQTTVAAQQDNSATPISAALSAEARLGTPETRVEARQETPQTAQEKSSHEVFIERGLIQPEVKADPADTSRVESPARPDYSETERRTSPALSSERVMDENRTSSVAEPSSPKNNNEPVEIKVTTLLGTASMVLGNLPDDQKEKIDKKFAKTVESICDACTTKQCDKCMVKNSVKDLLKTQSKSSAQSAFAAMMAKTPMPA